MRCLLRIALWLAFIMAGPLAAWLGFGPRWRLHLAGNQRVEWSPDGAWFVVSRHERDPQLSDDVNKGFALHSGATGAEIRRERVWTGPAAFAPDGSAAALARWAKPGIMILPTSAEAPVRWIAPAPNDNIPRLDWFAPELLSTCQCDVLEVFDVPTGRRLWRHETGSEINGANLFGRRGIDCVVFAAGNLAIGEASTSGAKVISRAAATGAARWERTVSPCQRIGRLASGRLLAAGADWHVSDHRSWHDGFHHFVLDPRDGAVLRRFEPGKRRHVVEDMGWRIDHRRQVHDMADDDRVLPDAERVKRLVANRGMREYARKVEAGLEPAMFVSGGGSEMPVAAFAMARNHGPHDEATLFRCELFDRQCRKLGDWSELRLNLGRKPDVVLECRYLAKPCLLAATWQRHGGQRVVEAHDVSPARRRLRWAVALGPAALCLAWLVRGVWRRRGRPAVRS